MKSKQKLWRKLQSLDRRISKIPHQMIWDGGKIFWKIDKRSKIYIKLDNQRKDVRLQLKAYNP